MNNTPSMSEPPFVELSCKVMNYAWGKIGESSLVAQLAKLNSGITIEPSTPYAELWIGTHPNAPSTLKHFPSVSLLDHLHHIAPNIPDLPYLLKVLSVAKPLSIQAHPNTHLAKQLFRTQPHLYKDPNHKPEMAIALTRFEALFGFRPISELLSHLQMYPELTQCTPYATQDLSTLDQQPAADVLKALVKGILETPKETMEIQLAQLVQRVSAFPSPSPLESLFLHVHSHFPGDSGAFFVFLMHHVVLQPGQALFMGANELHAYLYGDCVEVMATSDNVIRAGLTPKHKDIPTLVAMLHYTCRTSVAACVLSPERSGATPSAVVVYNPPIPEFCIHLATVPAQSATDIPVVTGVSVVLVIKGTGSIECDGERAQVAPGTVLCLRPRCAVRVCATETVEVVQAFCEEGEVGVQK